MKKRLDNIITFYKKKKKVLDENMGFDDIIDFGFMDMVAGGEFLMECHDNIRFRTVLLNNKEWLDVDCLMEAVEFIADEYYDGHYSIFRFTTNYRGAFGTPSASDFDIMKPEDRLNKTVSAKNLKGLLIKMLLENPSFYK